MIYRSSLKINRYTEKVIPKIAMFYSYEDVRKGNIGGGVSNLFFTVFIERLFLGVNLITSYAQPLVY